MTEQQVHNNLSMAKITIILITALHVLFSLGTQCMADNATVTSINNMNTYTVQNAINHARNRYGIDILVTEKLQDNRLDPWDRRFLPVDKWVDMVFKSYDKIVYYNDQGEVQSIIIVRVKNSQTNLAETNHSSVTRSVLSFESDPGEPSIAPSKVIVSSSAPAEYSQKDGEDFIIHQEAENFQLDAGVIIYHNNGNANDLAAAGVIIPNLPE